jgi:hypothetical protein
MFGGSTFMGLNGAGGQVRLAQAYPQAAAQPQAAPPPPPPPAAPEPAPAPVTAGMSKGTQVAIAAGILGVTVLGLLFATH